MDLNYSAEELAFRDEVRSWLRANLPQDLHDKVENYAHLSKDDLMRWHRILAKQGWVAPAWPKEWGGTGWNVVQRYIFEEELGYVGSPPLIPFGLTMCGPVLLRFGTDAQKAAYLPGILAGDLDFAIGYSEPEAGTDLAHPLLEATKVDGGWRLNGRKIFGTLSEIADLFLVSTRYSREDGTWASGFAFVFRGTEGQKIQNNWDSLGMRSSGSHDVVYEDAFIPDDLFFPGGDWGEETVLSLAIVVGPNLMLLAPFIGIAESARDRVVDMARRRTKAPSNRPIAERPGIQHLVAEMDVDLASARASLERATTMFDRIVLEGPIPTIEELHEMNHQFQCAKLVVNRKAIDIVDHALTVSGGAGYMAANPLARQYRDVRAGPFMQPYSPNEAHEYIGKVALGLPPEVTG